jgi:Txe/YoeB family toxin of toxin-antitoxin system
MHEKLQKLIIQIADAPKQGRGKPEKLNIGQFPNREFWSRRITEEKRLVYEIDENKKEVYLILCGGPLQKFKCAY